MSIFLDKKYIAVLSFHLDKFRKVDSDRFNFRCPVCGDSKKSSRLARGWIYPHDEKPEMWFKCWNCSISMSLKYFLKSYFKDIYKSYLVEQFGDRNKHKEIDDYDYTPARKMIFTETSVVDQLEKISDLDENHKAVQLLIKRKIPKKFYSYFYYAKNFKSWVNSWNKEKFENIKHDHDRLVIAYRDKDKKLIAIQGRSFSDQVSPKYLTLKVDESVDYIFGLDRVDPSKNVQIVEGPIDSMFLPNAIAVGSAGLNNPGFDDVTYIWDNEPRNAQIIKQTINKIIKNTNEKFCIWQNTNKLKFKDINDLAEHENLSLEQIHDLININTFSGLKALHIINNWKK